MFIRARLVVPCSLLAIIAGLSSACTGNVNGGGGDGGGSGGSSGSTCSYLCDLLATCPSSDCTFTDASAAVSACEMACESGLDAIPESEAAAISACYSCVNEAAGTNCSALASAATGKQCASACNASIFDKASTDWSNATAAAAAGNSALVCTNGRDALADESCSGGGGTGSGCVMSCCNGTCGAVPDVQITCEGTDPSDLSCSCTAGKAKGKVLSAPTCDAASSLDLWNTCGE